MKKVYSSRKYINWKITSAEKALRKKKFRKRRHRIYISSQAISSKWENYKPIEAPVDFRFVEQTEKCLKFFKDIRDKKNHYYKSKNYFVGLELRNVQFIDYSSVSVLKALLLDFKPNKIFVQGSSPENPECKNFLFNSGFFDGLLSLKNKPYNEKGNSDRIMFTQGQGLFSDEEDIKVIQILKKIRKHLTNQDGHCPQLRTIILEICGNSIEHSESYKKQWMFGVKYETDKVIITLVDTGKGILKTLYRKFGRKFADFLLKSNSEVLEGAFDQKYESKTLDINRNKGLPAIKHRFLKGYIKNLVVITNNVSLNFADREKSYISSSNGFDGTIFKLELDKYCFKNAND